MRYWRVFRIACANGFSYMLAYRADAVMKFLLGIGWTLVNIGILQILLLHTTNINGWNRQELLLLLLTFGFAADPLSFAGRYIEELEVNIRTGRFDGIVTKPMDSQFLSIFLRPDFSGIFFLISRQSPFIFLLLRDGFPFTWEGVLIYCLLIFFGNLIWLSLRVLLMTVNFWHQKLENIREILNTISEFTKYPLGIFPRPLRLVFYTIIPLAFMAVVPVEALRGNASLPLVMLSFGVTVFFVVLTRLVWKQAIKNYTSASS